MFKKNKTNIKNKLFLNHRVVLWENGNKREEYSYNRLNGCREGQTIHWYENGNIKKECWYSGGLLEGKYNEWYSNGKQSIECHYKNNKLEGTHRTWYYNGKQSTECHYKNDRINGICGTWYIDGIKKNRCYYTDGLLDGLFISWHFDGTKAKQCFYKNGLLEGIYITWYPNGIQSKEYYYYEGKREGIATIWYCDGSKAATFLYKNNNLVSIKHLYDIKGRDNVLPKGDTIVWKACRYKNINVYVKLLVTEGTKRVTVKDLSTFKSRVEYAIVLQIIDKSNNQYLEAESFVYGETLRYVKGQIVKSNNFNDDPNIICGQGINVHMYKDQCDKWFVLNKN